MEFKLSDEFVTEHKLTPEQVEAFTGHVTSAYVPELKKSWDGKANTDAEKIIQGAIDYTKSKLGVELDRKQGEKHGDYLARLSDSYYADKTSALEQQQIELQDKLKNFKGSDEIKQQLTDALEQLDTYKKQVAELEPLKGLDEKYKAATEELSGLKLNVAFNKEKPNFGESVNKYEAAAKWDAFRNKVLEKHTIELVEGVPMAIDKENIHKQTKLSELVAADEELKNLMEGRQQGGTGGKQKPLHAIEGVPFKVPENASSEEKSKLVKEYLVTQGIGVTHPDYTKRFTEIYSKMAKKAA